MKTYTAVLVKTQPFVPEIISGIVSLISSLTGIEERENELICFFSEFNDDDLSYLKNLLSNLKSESLIERFEIYTDTIEQKNWNEEWEKIIQPIKVTDKIVIKPSFREYKANEDEIIITIDPKMSFGTGYHQSTRIMIRMIQRNIIQGMKVLDVGTGTGILAIVCAKLGANKIITCDNDEFVEENVLENFEKNQVLDKCSFVFGTIDEIYENDFDMILANIQKNVLIDIAEKIKQRTKKKGLVLLAGLLLTDEEEIIEKYSSLNFKLIEKEIEDEWLGLVFELED
jgi:ribosomal protein L11 methyltransferase